MTDKEKEELLNLIDKLHRRIQQIENYLSTCRVDKITDWDFYPDLRPIHKIRGVID